MEPTPHAGQHVEAAAAAYLAPEFTAEVDGTVAIDVFGLGATSYLILTGRAPAAGRAELIDRLAVEGGLHPSVVAESIPPDIDALVALATSPRVTDRLPDVSNFLEELDGLIASTTPEEQPADPWEAQADAELPDGYVVTRVLGTGATARAFLVQRDGLESVLRVGRTAEAESRLEDEAVVFAITRGMRDVLLGADPPGVVQSRRAAAGLAELRDHHSGHVTEGGTVLRCSQDEMSAGGRGRAWPPTDRCKPVAAIWSIHVNASAIRYCGFVATPTSGTSPLLSHASPTVK